MDLIDVVRGDLGGTAGNVPTDYAYQQNTNHGNNEHANHGNEDNFLDLCSFAMHPATYQSGPLIPHSKFRERTEKLLDKNENENKPETKRQHELRREWFPGPRVSGLLSSLFKLALWCLLVDVLYWLGYAPVASFFGGGGGGRTQHVQNSADAATNALPHFFRNDFFTKPLTRLIKASGQDTTAQTVAFATVSWITSHVVFGLPFVLASFVADGGVLQGVVPCDTPLFWPCASAGGPGKFWRTFHASFFGFYYKRVFAPVGGGVFGVLLSVLVSTLFHGVSKRWLLWGVVTGLALVTERTVRNHAKGSTGNGTEVTADSTVHGSTVTADSTVHGSTATAASTVQSSTATAGSTVHGTTTVTADSAVHGTARNSRRRRLFRKLAFSKTTAAALVHAATVSTFVAPSVFPGLHGLVVLKVLAWGVVLAWVWAWTGRTGQVIREKSAKRD